jgi:hypothetical protein
LPSKYEALSTIPSTAREIRERKREIFVGLNRSGFWLMFSYRIRPRNLLQPREEGRRQKALKY